MTSYIVDEINAYVAIRDIALAEAEKDPTSVNLERVRIANEFCRKLSLKPARSPYKSQSLPETDAARERADVARRSRSASLSLRAHLGGAISRDHAHARRKRSAARLSLALPNLVVIVPHSRGPRSWRRRS